MPIKSTRRAGKRLVEHGLWGAASAALLLGAAAADAKAEIQDHISVSNLLEHSYLPGQVKDKISGASARIHRSPAPGIAPEYGADFNSTHSAGGFYFLHNLYCVSLCSSRIKTRVTIEVTNIGDQPAPYRIDSQITPGHLVRQGSNSTASASFDFKVTVVTPTADGYTSKTGYAAFGAVDSHTNEVKTSTGQPFNNVKHIQNGAASDVRDWSATNISVPLGTIPPGVTVTVYYDAVTQAKTTDSECGDQLANCPGIQIAFGDPRDGGDGTNHVSTAVPMLVDLKAPADARPPYGRARVMPLIGRTFAPYWVKVDIVPDGAPPPPEPEAMPDVQYGAPFKSQTIPGPVAKGDSAPAPREAAPLRLALADGAGR